MAIRPEDVERLSEEDLRLMKEAEEQIDKELYKNLPDDTTDIRIDLKVPLRARAADVLVERYHAAGWNDCWLEQMDDEERGSIYAITFNEVMDVRGDIMSKPGWTRKEYPFVAAEIYGEPQFGVGKNPSESHRAIASRLLERKGLLSRFPIFYEALKNGLYSHGFEIKSTGACDIHEIDRVCLLYHSPSDFPVSVTRDGAVTVKQALDVNLNKGSISGLPWKVYAKIKVGAGTKWYDAKDLL